MFRTLNGQQCAVSCIFVNYIRLSSYFFYCIPRGGISVTEDIILNNAYQNCITFWRVSQKEPALPKDKPESVATAMSFISKIAFWYEKEVFYVVVASASAVVEWIGSVDAKSYEKAY